MSSSFTLGIASGISAVGTAVPTNAANGTQLEDLALDSQAQLTNGSTSKLNDFHEHLVPLWFATIGCAGCEVGAQLFDQQYYSQLLSKGVIEVTKRLYDNLGFKGYQFSNFASQHGGAGLRWVFAANNQNSIYTHDFMAYLQFYPIVGSQGKMVVSDTGLAADLPNMVTTFGTR
ncbi:MAG: hypothetical protein QW767_06365 [Thermoprotei archaeon]